MKNYIAIAFLFLNFLLHAQVGINTTLPNATLDVVGNPTTSSSMDGIIPPRLSGNQLNTKTYTMAQEGAIVYITNALTNTNNGQCANVITKGYYFFDSSVWQKVNFKESITTLSDVDVTTLTPNIGDKLVWNGTNWSTERAFFVSVYGTDSNSFGEFFTTYVHPNVISDSMGSYNTTTGIITIPFDGLYIIQGTLRPSDESVIDTQFGVGVHTSNTDGYWFSWHSIQHTTNLYDRTSFQYSRIVRFNANDTIRMYVHVDNGPLTMDGASLSVYKLSD